MHFHQNRANAAFFRDAICVHGLDSYRLSSVGDIVTRFANGAIKKKWAPVLRPVAL